MRTTYAVAWQEGDGTVHEGRLELREGVLRLQSPDTVCEIPFRSVSEVRLAEDEVGGRPALTLDRRDGKQVRIASAAQTAMVSELADRLAELVLAQRRTARVVVVVPIKPAARPQVRTLLAKGPPFDLETSGLDAHHVFMTDHEVVFIFEASEPSVLQRLAARMPLVAAAEAWQELAEGSARIAEDAYSWTRGSLSEGLSFAATPGPGDSEGGDLYPP